MSLNKYSGASTVEPYLVPLESTMLNGIVVILSALYAGASIMRFSNEVPHS